MTYTLDAETCSVWNRKHFGSTSAQVKIFVSVLDGDDGDYIEQPAKAVQTEKGPVTMLEFHSASAEFRHVGGGRQQTDMDNSTVQSHNAIFTRRQLGRSRTSGVSRTCVTHVPTQHGTFVAPATRSSALGADHFTPSVHHRRNVSHKCNHDSRNTSGNLTATGHPVAPVTIYLYK